MIGWKELSSCNIGKYDLEKDCYLFMWSAGNFVNIGMEHFGTFFPNDAHAPKLGIGQIRKIVVKVAVI